MLIEANDWEPIRMRMVTLEHDIYSWSSLLPNMLGSAPAAEIQRVTMIRDSAQAELSCLRVLLRFWDEHQPRGKREISLQIAIVAFAIYLAAVSAVLAYLVALAGR